MSKIKDQYEGKYSQLQESQSQVMETIKEYQAELDQLDLQMADLHKTPTVRQMTVEDGQDDDEEGTGVSDLAIEFQKLIFDEKGDVRSSQFLVSRKPQIE
jgi:hypothetical protein